MRTIRSNPRDGFTLVELLVVIGIIGVLLAILLPTLGRARQAAARTACAGQLRDIGMMYNMYLNDNRQRVPRVNPVPSVVPALFDGPSIVGALEPYHRGQTRVFSCPSDRIINVPDDVDRSDADDTVGVIVSDAQTYYEREGTSYQYNEFFNAFSVVGLNGPNKVWQAVLSEAKQRRNVTPDQLDILRDFDPFHDTAGKPTSRNYLYADFHVGDNEGRRVRIRNRPSS